MKKSWAILSFASLMTLALGAPGAVAFSSTSSPSSVDTKAANRVADPEDLMNDMSAQPSGSVRTYSFDTGASLQFNAPSDPNTGVESRFVTNPSTVIVPSHR